MPHYVMRPAFWLENGRILTGGEDKRPSIQSWPSGAGADRAGQPAARTIRIKWAARLLLLKSERKSPREWYPASAGRADETSPIRAASFPVRRLTAPMEAQMIIPHLAGSGRLQKFRLWPS